MTDFNALTRKFRQKIKNMNHAFHKPDRLQVKPDPSARKNAQDTDSDKVSQLWGKRAEEKYTDTHITDWTESSIVQRHYIHPTISGCSDDNWLIWVKKKFFATPVSCGLSLGCADGCLERHARLMNICNFFDAYDISADAIDIARKKALETGTAGVSYHTADLNEIVLPKSKYDVVFSAMALHHIENLEHIFKQIKRSLKPKGLFILNEFVGPSRFQWTDKQVAIANEILLLIPEKYRLCRITDTIKTKISQPTVSAMISTDPSEAVRSSEIIDMVQSFFQIIHRNDYGGTIINILLEGIVDNFSEDNEEDMAILKLIFYMENFLIGEKTLPSDFTLLICRNE